MPRQTLRILHGNGKNKISLVNWVKRATWNSAGLAEVEHLIGALGNVHNSKLVVTDEKFDRAKEAPILVRGPHHVLSSRSVVASRALGKPGSDLNRVAPARVVTVVYYSNPVARACKAKGIAHINAHPPAGPEQLKQADSPITKEYKKVMDEIAEAWAQTLLDDMIPVLTMDGQLPQGFDKPWGPRALSHRLNANFHCVGIDWMMWDKRLTKRGRPIMVRLFDHPGFILSFVPNLSRVLR